MLGQKRKYKHLRKPMKRVPLERARTFDAQSNTMLYNCTKYEKFFHYYTACGILVDGHGFVELQKRPTHIKHAQQSPYQLVYKHSKAPVLLDLCDETSYTQGTESRLECDLDMLIDDNALRVGVTDTSKCAALQGESVDSQHLHAKRRECIEESQRERYVDEHLLHAVASDEFGDSVDAERPRHFLAKNLVDMILLNTSLCEYVAVYLVPVPELRRTRVQFYWCVRETKIPYSPLVAQWMLQNYVDRCGPLETVDCDDADIVPSTRQTQFDMHNFVFSQLLRQRQQQGDGDAAERDANEDSNNDSIQQSWETFRREHASAGIALPTVAEWLETVSSMATAADERRPLRSGGPPRRRRRRQEQRHRVYGTTLKARTMANITAIRVNNASTTSGARCLSKDSFASSATRAAFYGAFRQDALCLSDAYLNYCRRHNLRCAHSDVFSTARQYPLHSTNELFDFSFFVEDLRRYCAAEQIDATVASVDDNDGNASCDDTAIADNNRLRFECAFGDNDVLLLDADMQMALKRAGLVTMPSSVADDHGADLGYNFVTPRLDDDCKFSLAVNCRSPDVQLCLGTLLSQVARLEIEQVEPYQLEPPLFDSVALAHGVLLSGTNGENIDGDGRDLSLNGQKRQEKERSRDEKKAEAENAEEDEENDDDNGLFLSHQQSSLFEWVRMRESATIAIKERQILRQIHIASTGWRYHVATGELRYESVEPANSTASTAAGAAAADDAAAPSSKRRRTTATATTPTTNAAAAATRKTPAAPQMHTEQLNVFSVEVFNRNEHRVFDRPLDFSVEFRQQRRSYEQSEEPHNVLFISGGACSGKRVALLAQILYDLSGAWRCMVDTEHDMHTLLDKMSRQTSTTTTTTTATATTALYTRQARRNARMRRKTVAAIQRNYFKGAQFARHSSSLTNARTNVQLGRVSLLHQLHMLWRLHLIDELFEEAPVGGSGIEEGQIYDSSALLVRKLLDFVITCFEHNETLSLETIMSELWYSYGLLHKHRDTLSMSAASGERAVDAAVRTLHKKRELIEMFEPERLRHSKLASRATLIVCPSDEIDKWLQALQVFGNESGGDGNTAHVGDAWWFVGSRDSLAPIDAAIYCIRSAQEWQDFSVARLIAVDIVLLTYECLAQITTGAAAYLQPFCNNVTALKTAQYCDSMWMRCVRQHMAILESTPCISLLKTPAEVERLSKGKQLAYAALEHVPIEAIRWERLVLANYDSFCRRAALQARPTRSVRAWRVTNFLRNVRCVRKVVLSSEPHSTHTLNSWLLPVLSSNNVVSTMVSEPLTPACLESYRRRWRHAYDERTSHQFLTHPHPYMMLFYARQCQSLVVDGSHTIRQRLRSAQQQRREQQRQKSNPFVAKDVLHRVTLDREQCEAQQHLTVLLNLTQELQALHRCHESLFYSPKLSSASFFSHIGEQSTFDVYKGLLSHRSPSHLLLGTIDNAGSGAHVNSAVSAAQRSAVPTHIFVSQSRDHVRLVRLLDRYDPISWRDFRFSRTADSGFLSASQLLHRTSSSVDVLDVRQLKPTYRTLLTAALHSPQLLPLIREQITELYLYRVGRLMSTLTRSSIDTPEFPFSMGNSTDVLGRSAAQSSVIEQQQEEQDAAEHYEQSVVEAAESAAAGATTTLAGERTASTAVGEEPSPPLTPRDTLLLNSWFDQLAHHRAANRSTGDANGFSSRYHYSANVPNLACLEQRRAVRSEERQDRVERSDTAAYRDLLRFKVSSALVDETEMLGMFGSASRPDFCTGMSSCAEMGEMRVPVHSIELLSSAAANSVGYRHAQLATADRCLLAICDSALNSNYKTMCAALQKAESACACESDKLARHNDERALNDPQYYHDASLRLIGADELLGIHTMPKQTQRLTRRGLVASLKKLREEFFCCFAFGLCRYLSKVTTDSNIKAYLANLADAEHVANEINMRFGESNYNEVISDASDASDSDEMYIILSEDNDGEDENDNGEDADGDGDNDDDGDDDNDDSGERRQNNGTVRAHDNETSRQHQQQQAQRQRATTITVPISPALRRLISQPPTMRQRVQATMSAESFFDRSEQLPALDDAIDQQQAQLQRIMHRYIVTEQNLLFERRCADWMLVQFICDLDRFVSTFNTHSFLKQVPLLCRLDDQCGAGTAEERTSSQQLFAQKHPFYADNELLRYNINSNNSKHNKSSCDNERTTAPDYMSLRSEQLHKIAEQHLEHYHRTLMPLIEMLLYSGQIHGYLRRTPSPELLRLLADSDVDEREQQKLLKHVVGGVKTAAPTYLINVIGKFRYETRWIARDLNFIRQQRKRTVGALPGLRRLRDSLRDYLEKKKAGDNDNSDSDEDDMFECAMCMGSLLEAENVALYPCGHVCCYSCHTRCNTALHRPRVEENTVDVGISTPGLRCFVCRYLLQFNERVIKTTFGNAVERLLSPPTQSAAATLPVERLETEAEEKEEEEEVVVTATMHMEQHDTAEEQADGRAAGEEENLTMVLPPPSLETPPPVLPPDLFSSADWPLESLHYLCSSSNSSDSLEMMLDDAEPLSEPLGANSLLDDALCAQTTAAASAATTPLFTKNASVVQALLRQLAQFAGATEYSKLKKLIVVSNYARCLVTIQDQLKQALSDAHADSYRCLMVETNFLPLPYCDQCDIEKFLVEESWYTAKVPVAVYFYHMDLQFDVTNGDCFSGLRYMSDVDAVFLVEPPAVRLVDDRGSHMLAVELEQRLLAKFCNEFSSKKRQTTVHRFLVDYDDGEMDNGANVVATIDRQWYQDTRWYGDGDGISSITLQ